MPEAALDRDYRAEGPVYSIEPGHPVPLKLLPMDGATAANTISTWVNNTAHTVALIDQDAHTIRPLTAHHTLQEPAAQNDTVDLVGWLP